MSAAAEIRPTPWIRLRDAFLSFMTRPASPRPLAALRIGLTTVLLVQAFALAFNLLDLFGPRAIVQWRLNEFMNVDGLPRLGWFSAALQGYATAEQVTQGFFLVYVGSLSMMLIGWHTRIASVLAWFSHLVLFMTERAAVYGVDDFAHIALFYCMWMPIGNFWSLDVHSGRASSAPSVEARIGLRVWQIHLCIVYLSSAIEKSLGAGSQWISGELMWRTIMMPTFISFDLSFMAEYPLLVRMGTWGPLAVEFVYAFLIWPKRTRALMAWSTIAMHVGIAIMMGLRTFGAEMAVFTAAVWLFRAED